MAERETEVSYESQWEKVDEKQYRAVIESDSVQRRIVHEYFVCQYVVVEIEKLFEMDEPVAVFRTPLTVDELGDFDDKDELVQRLQRFALDSPSFQLVEEFEASVKTFESGT